MSHRRGKAKAQRPEVDDFRDEIDEYIDDRQNLEFIDDDNDRDEEDDENELENAMDLSIEDEESEEDDDDEDEVQSEVESEDEDDKQNDDRIERWGSKKQYYASDEEEDVSYEDSDEENAINEEEEVKRLQKKRAAARSESDFDTLADLVNNKTAPTTSNKTFTSHDSSLLESMHKDLEAISLQQPGALDDAIEKVTRDVGSLTREEKLELIQKDSPELFTLLDSLKEKISELRNKLHPLIRRIRDGFLPTSKGVNYLEVKYHLLLNYCINICFYLLLKAEGRSVKNHPVIEQLVKIRVLIDKLKPLDQKLKYQIDKLVKMATTADSEEFDSKLMHRPNLAAMASGDEEEGEEMPKLDKYVPPKISAVHADSKAEKNKRRAERREEKARQSSMAQHIIEEFGDEPVEQPADLIARRREVDEEEQERIRYEEEYLQRLTVSKKERKKRQRVELPNELNDLEEWADMAMLSRGAEADELEMSTAKSKKAKLAALLNSIEQSRNKPSAPARGGDEDIPRPEFAPPSKKQKTREVPDTAANFDDFGGEEFISLKDNVSNTRDMLADDASDEPDVPTRKQQKRKFTAEDEEAAEAMLSEARSRQQEKAEAKEQRKKELLENKLAVAAEPTAEGKRKITYQIERNLGIQKAKANKAEKRNPRVKKREQYRKALIRRKGQVQSIRDQSQPYSGEATGISTKAVRSISLR